MKKLTLVLLALSSVALAVQRRQTADRWDAYLPEENAAPGYASSRACRSCHPSQYDSWYGSYHRTMTEWASPESIVPAWDGVDFGFDGRSYRLFKRDGEFYVDMPKHGTAGTRPEDRLELPVLMTTGSHQMQYYWLPVPWAEPDSVEGEDAYRRHCAACHNDHADGGALEGVVLGAREMQTLWRGATYHSSFDTIGGRDRAAVDAFLERIQFPGRIVQFPFVYFVREKRWLHDSYTFLQPEEPYSSVEPYGKNWNGNCDACHTTSPDYRWDSEEQLGQTEVTELGIACESCHGPGRAHVEHHRNPLSRYRAHLGGRAPSDIVNPGKLDAAASASVCAQCHAELVPKPERDRFRPGESIDAYAHVLQQSEPPHPEWLQIALEDEPDLFRNAFWPDGTMRIAGRDYNALAKSACFLEGGLTCVTCHTLHGKDPNDQLREAATGGGVCLSCHAEHASDIEAHTHHAPGSEGSRCYNCHMPRTTWGLLGSIRAHRVDSPSVGAALTTGRPDACSLCHLDRSLGDIAGWMTKWYGQPALDLSAEERNLAASIRWAMSGDAVQRATAAWHMGEPGAKSASGDDWQPAYLVELLDDPYAAVRFAAFESLAGYAGFEDLRYDVQWPSYQRLKVVKAARVRVVLEGERDRPALLIANGELDIDALLALQARRDDTPVLVAE